MFYKLKIAFRSLKLNAAYSIVNIIGLGVSLAVCILIILWVHDELSYEKSYEHSDHIYMVVLHRESDGQSDYLSSTPAALSKAAKEEIAEVEEACVVNFDYDLGFLEYNGKNFFGNKYFCADTSFFRIFENKFIEGSPEHVFPDQNSVVITERLAKKIFGNESALGKHIKGGNGGGKTMEDYYVSAVVANPPANTRFQYDAVFSFQQSRFYKDWNIWAFGNFLLLNKDADKKTVCSKLKELHKKYSPDVQTGMKSYELQALKDMHLYYPDGSENGMSRVRLFSLIALILLVIACINYVNLITARANKRSKEISIRKILGAGKSQLFFQLLNEAIILFIVSMLLASLLVFLLIPFYNQVTGKEFNLSLTHSVIFAVYGSMLLLIILLAGIYPAVKLASFRPIDVFRPEKTFNTAGFSLRKILVISQFTCTIGLIMSSIAMNMQLQYIHKKPLGYNKERVFSMWIFTNLTMRTHYEGFKHNLEKEPSIAGVTASEQNILNVGNSTSEVTWDGTDNDRNLNISLLGVDRNFFSFMGMKQSDGSGFTDTPADSFRYYLNETAVRQMGLSDPVGKLIKIEGKEGTIAGIIDDFHFRHMDTPIGSIAMYLPRSYWTIYIKTKEGKADEAIAATERIWKKYNQEFPFNYRFMDDEFNEMYRSEQQLGSLFSCFTIVAIAISCLGLFGLVTYSAERKTKEIGIRKVLGAGVFDIVKMLSSEYSILIVISMLIAFPLSYYLLNKMLQVYVYRIYISWDIFLIAGIFTILMTSVTIGIQVFKAARKNPVNSVKSE